MPPTHGDDVDVDWEDGQTIAVSIVPTSILSDSEEPAANTPATGLPTISGSPQVGETLTAETSAISDVDGLSNVSYAYQWSANDGTVDTDIEHGTDATYLLIDDYASNTIKVRVTFSDDADNAESLTSEATDAVAPRPNTPATGLPTISGTPNVDELLTADTSDISDEDGLENVTYEYQWISRRVRHSRSHGFQPHPYDKRAGKDDPGPGDLH